MLYYTYLFEVFLESLESLAKIYKSCLYLKNQIRLSYWQKSTQIRSFNHMIKTKSHILSLLSFTGKIPFWIIYSHTNSPIKRRSRRPTHVHQPREKSKNTDSVVKRASCILPTEYCHLEVSLFIVFLYLAF